MKKLSLIILLLTSGYRAFSQVPDTDRSAVQNVINKLFDGMRKGDSSLVSSAMSKNIVMQTISGTGANIRVRTDNPQNFLKMIATPHTEVYDERITFDNIQIDAGLASVWTSYRFYVGDNFSHCGVNSITLVKESGDWKILHIIDTRRKEQCGG